ncbi:MAG: serpin family protein [Patescibacteria group bacterium]|jgi:serpin B
MKKKILVIMVLALVAIVCADVLIYFSKNNPFIKSPSATTNNNKALACATAVVDVNNGFAFNLYNQLKNDSGNVFFSPYSLSTAFAMVYEGARGNTAKEMQAVFQFPTDETDRRIAYQALNDRLTTTNTDYQFNVANALWVQQDYKLQADYLNTVHQYFGGEATNLDFANNPEASRNTINTWVADKTNDKIKDLFPNGTISEITKLVLTNAVYFKGEWLTQFNQTDTSEENFNISSTETVRVPMMQQTNTATKFRYVADVTTQVLELPYQGKQLSMLVLLPKTNDLSILESSLSVKQLDAWKASLNEQLVDVYLPKFTLDTKYTLNDTLKAMGMPTAFSTNADFSGMDGTKDLFIQSVIHQAFIDVNEAGTEAAAATGVTTSLSAAQTEIPVFRADHPFVFIILDNQSGNILFMGRMVDPLK